MKKETKIFIRVSTELKDKVDKWAQRNGMTTSEWIRDEIITQAFGRLIKCPYCTHPVTYVESLELGQKTKCELCGKEFAVYN